MRSLTRAANRFAREEYGTTAIGYALIAGLIAAGMLAGLTALGGGMGTSWNSTAERVTDATGGR